MHVIETFEAMLLNCQKESQISLRNGNPLMAPAWQLASDQAIYVEGLGHLETFYSKGVVYFLRDYLTTQIEMHSDNGTPSTKIRPLVARLNALNSDIRQWEQNGAASNRAPERV